MAGNANSGRKREIIPKGKEAEEELRRLKRQQRRRERAARKKAAAAGIKPEAEDEEDEFVPMENADGSPLTVEQLRNQLMSTYQALGGQANMVAWARRYPKEFYNLWAKYCLPKEEEDKGEQGSLEALLAQLDKRERGALH